MWPPEWMGEDAQAQLKKLPGPPPIPFEAGAAQQGARDRRRAARHRLLGRAARAGGRGDRGDGGGAGARVAADIPSGVDATTGEVEGPAVHCVATATFHRPKLGLWIHPGKEYAGEVEVVEIGIPRGGPARPEAGLIGAGVLRDMPRRGVGLDEVHLRQRVHHRRLARADGRAVDGRAGRDARRGGLRDGRRAGQSSS